MKKADLNLLVIFDAIMREGSMTRAATQLAMTQPAVSNAVARMRTAWNDPVFVRDGRGIIPTPHAQIMWDRARAHLDDLREMVNPEPFDPATAERTFRICAPDLNVGLLWRGLRRRVERFAPGIDFHAVPISKPHFEEQLLNAEGDVSIAVAPAQPNDHLRHEPLLDSHFVCAMRPEHPLAGDTLSLEAFAAADHLLVSLTGDATGHVDELLLEQGMSRRVAMTVNHFFLAANLLRESDLISIVPYAAVAEQAYRGELHITRPPLDVPPITLSLLWHERSDRDAGHRWLREQIHAVTREIKQALPMPAGCQCPDMQVLNRAPAIEPEVDMAISA